jgi:hypothetical protein
MRRNNQRHAILYTEFLIRGESKRLPRSPDLLQRCIEALLHRWQGRHPEEVRWLSDRLLWLAGAEYYFRDFQGKEYAQLEKDFYREAIQLLSNGKPGKLRLKQHRTTVLHLQRNLLNNLLRKEVPYPSAKSMRERRQWLNKNWEDLSSRLYALPCWCHYDYDHFHSPPAAVLNTFQCYARKSELIIELLAFLHSTTAQQVEKLLRPSLGSSNTSARQVTD